MPSDDQIARAIDKIYDVALEPAQWTELLRHIGQLVGASQGSLMLLARTHNTMTDFGYDRNEEMMALFNARFRAEDRWLEPALKFGAGVVLTGQQLCPTNTFEQTAYYQECLKPGEIYDCLAVMLEDGRELNAGVSFHRPDFLPPFSGAEKKILSVLIPHLRRLVQIHRKLDGCNLRATLQADALNRLTFGVIVLGAEDGVLFANRMARQIVNERDGLRLTSKGLTACRTDDDAALVQAQKRALPASTQPKIGPRGRTLSVRRTSLKRPYTVQIMPLGDGALYKSDVFGAGQQAALVTITDPARARAQTADVLASAYGLTPAEVELTTRIGDGDSLKDAAERLSISEQTARWHLKNVLAKMDVSRQSELVSVLIQMAPPLS